MTIVRLGADVVGSSPAARQFFFMYFPLTHSVSFFFLYIYIYINFFQYSILLHFNQFISSLAALVWGSDRGGPVGEAEKTGGRVCVADPKLKRDG